MSDCTTCHGEPTLNSEFCPTCGSHYVDLDWPVARFSCRQQGGFVVWEALTTEGVSVNGSTDIGKPLPQEQERDLLRQLALNCLEAGFRPVFS